MKNKFLPFLFLLMAVISCDNYEEVTPDGPGDSIDVGTGFYSFDYQTSDSEVDMEVFYHVPDADITTMPILFVLHGAGRNAVEYRNAWIEEAETKEFIVVTPKFSSFDFPGGDAYNLGNVFEDGDNPSASTLNPEQDWTYSIIESLFDDVKSQLGNLSGTYNVFGFSAGGQFAHRFLMFKPNSRVNKVISSASGWYTVPDGNIEFPYGIDNSPIENTPSSVYFSKQMTIQIGTLDNDPNASALRRNPTVDQQGTNRYDRAYHMFNRSKAIAEDFDVPFNWQIIETPGNAHNNRGAVEQAAEVLFD